MFPILQLEILDRFTEVEQHFKGCPARQGVAAQMSKGIVFVEVYAVYEFAIRRLTQIAIDAIASHSHEIRSLPPSLAAIFLDAELNSLRDCNSAKVWEKRLQLFEKRASASSIGSVIAIPHDGSHFRHTQLQMIFRALGIRRAITRRIRHRYFIDEIVDNRNDIAHGHKTAAEVGRRYSRSETWHHIDLTRRICLRLVTVFAEHCANPAMHLG